MMLPYKIKSHTIEKRKRKQHLCQREVIFLSGVCMEEKRIQCNVCNRKGKEVFMIEKHDMLICPICKTSIIMKDKSPLGRYKEAWERNAENIFPLVRPPLYLNDLANPRLFFLYEDCYHTLLIGKYNASIVLMGILLEALMKERIWLKLGIYFRGAYGTCLRKIENEKLMDAKDISFLRKFKDNIRNPYQHADDAQIVEEMGFYRAYPIPIDNSKPVAKQLEQGMKSVKTGKLKPVLIPVTHPLVRDIAKKEYDRERVVGLFNQVYDFLLRSKIKYFKQEEYEEHHKKFGKPI